MQIFMKCFLDLGSTLVSNVNICYLDTGFKYIVLSWWVLCSKNPSAQTLHFNYHYFETDAPRGSLLYASKI